MDVFEFIRVHFRNMTHFPDSMTSRVKKSKVHPRDKQAAYKRNLVKIKYFLENHPSLRTVQLEYIQKYVRRILKNSDSIHLQQPLIVDILRFIHSKGVNLNDKDSKQRTVLHLAVKCRLTQIIDFLISCNVNLYDSFGNSILHSFIVSEASNFAKQIHKNKSVSISYLIPIKKQSIEFIEWMLQKDINVDSQNNNGDTALHLAAKYNLLHTLPLLLKHSRNVAITNNCGMNAFQVLLNSVINFGENAKSEEISLRPGTFIPTNYYESDFVDEIYKTFVSKGCSIDAIDNNGYTAIHHLLMQKRLKLVKLMSDYFTNVNARDKDGNTVLQIALNSCKQADKTCRDYHDIVRTFVSNGANVYQMNNDYISPLITAVVDHKDTLLKILTEHGADLRYQQEGRNLLHLICKSKMDITYKSCRDAFRFLVNQGCDLNAKDFYGKAPLHYAARYGTSKIIHAFVACGANLNVRDSINGYTPLHEAVRSNREKIVNALAMNGADVNAKTGKGETALSLAKKLKKSLRDTLIEFGACIDIEENDGHSYCCTAICDGYETVKKFRFCDGSNDDVHVQYDKKSAFVSKSVTENLNNLENNEPVSISVNENSNKSNATCTVDEKSRGVLTERAIMKSCKGNHNKSLYYLMHVNRQGECSLSVNNDNLQTLEISNLRNWLANTWALKAQQKAKLSKRFAFLMSKKC